MSLTDFVLALNDDFQNNITDVIPEHRLERVARLTNDFIDTLVKECDDGEGINITEMAFANAWLTDNILMNSREKMANDLELRKKLAQMQLHMLRVAYKKNGVRIVGQ